VPEVYSKQKGRRKLPDIHRKTKKIKNRGSPTRAITVGLGSVRLNSLRVSTITISIPLAVSVSVPLPISSIIRFAVAGGRPVGLNSGRGETGWATVGGEDCRARMRGARAALALTNGCKLGSQSRIFLIILLPGLGVSLLKLVEGCADDIELVYLT
jgi:hypothetical protein